MQTAINLSNFKDHKNEGPRGSFFKGPAGGCLSISSLVTLLLPFRIAGTLPAGVTQGVTLREVQVLVGVLF